MISDQSKVYFKTFDKLRYKFFKYFKYKSLDKFVDLIKYGIIPRPHYALGLVMAAHQAKELGYDKISVIEFGCWECDGLIDLENYIEDIKKFINIDFNVYGFDLGDGHPKNNHEDPRNRSYELSVGDYPFTKKKNLKKLKYTKLILGDVKDTVPNFLETNNFLSAPLGFIAFDLGYYTSTKNALEVLKNESKYYIPRPILYCDNNYFVLSNEGDKLAFDEFNNENKKVISPIGELAEQMSLSWKKWIFLGKRMYQLSDLAHEKYNIHYEQRINMRLNAKFTKTII